MDEKKMENADSIKLNAPRFHTQSFVGVVMFPDVSGFTPLTAALGKVQLPPWILIQ
jgi:hypothetical protein